MFLLPTGAREFFFSLVPTFFLYENADAQNVSQET
jgi:hypothetical protein